MHTQGGGDKEEGQARRDLVHEIWVRVRVCVCACRVESMWLCSMTCESSLWSRRVPPHHTIPVLNHLVHHAIPVLNHVDASRHVLRAMPATTHKFAQHTRRDASATHVIDSHSVAAYRLVSDHSGDFPILAAFSTLRTHTGAGPAAGTPICNLVAANHVSADAARAATRHVRWQTCLTSAGGIRPRPLGARGRILRVECRQP